MALIFILLLYCYPGLVVFFKSKKWNWHYLTFILLSSFLINTLVVFWYCFFFNWQKTGLLVSLLLFPWLLRWLKKYLNWQIEYRQKFPLATLPLVVIWLGLNLYLFYPLIHPLKVENYVFFHMPDIFDLAKHLYVTTAVYTSGIPPLHPYFPVVKLFYYYGYYLLPAALHFLTNLGISSSFFIHYAITFLTTIGLLLLLTVQFARSKLSSFLTFGFASFFFGFDLIANSLIYKIILKIAIPSHIEKWYEETGSKLQITSPYSASIWVPQHLLASVLALFVIFTLYKSKKITPLFCLLLGFLAASVFFLSSFAGLSLISFIGVIIIAKLFQKELKLYQLKNLLLFPLAYLISYLPFFLNVFQNRFQLLSFKMVTANKLFSNFFIATAYQWLVNIPLEFGLVIILAAITSWQLIKAQSKLLPIIIVAWLHLLIVHLITSPEPNDFGMRFIMPAQFLFIFLAGKAATKIKSKLGYFCLALAILIGSLGAFWEFKERWQNREISSWETSQVAQYTQTLTPKGKPLLVWNSPFTPKWAEYIPVLGERMICSANLYNSAVYFRNPPKFKAEFDLLAKDVFEFRQSPLPKFDPHSYLEDLQKWLIVGKKCGAEKLILREQIWVEEDKEPIAWLLTNLLKEKKKIGNHFVFSIDNILEKLKNIRIEKDGQFQKVKLEQERQDVVFPKSGLWLLTACFGPQTPTRIFDLVAEKHYPIFSVTQDIAVPSICFTRLFVVSEAGSIRFKTNAPGKTVLKLQKLFLSQILGK